MTCIDATGLSFRQVNEAIAAAKDADVLLEHALGQRYIGAGSAGRRIRIEGVPGNALGAYLDGTRIEVAGNAQDATGDTMNDGEIVIHGSCGDAAGYAMRGGRIFVRGNVGYRAGIHMKAYQEKIPVLIVGGEAGSFLGEYQAGGCIAVLGLETRGRAPVGDFCATGMHGGVLYLRADALPEDLPAQVMAVQAEEADLAFLRPHVADFCRAFSLDMAHALSQSTGSTSCARTRTTPTTAFTRRTRDCIIGKKQPPFFPRWTAFRGQTPSPRKGGRKHEQYRQRSAAIRHRQRRQVHPPGVLRRLRAR